MLHLLAAAHPFWPVLFRWPRFLDLLSWFWLSVKGYAFTSSGLQLTIPAGMVMWWRRHNCHSPWCPLLGHHKTNDGMYQLCAYHHPDVPKRTLRRVRLHEILERHHDARRVD